jgi:hypothetical protein
MSRCRAVSGSLLIGRAGRGVEFATGLTLDEWRVLMMRRIVWQLAWAVSLVLTGAACSTQHIVKPVGPNGGEGERGVFYALPRTVILVDLPVTRVDKTPSLMMKEAKGNQTDLDVLKKDATSHLGLSESDLTIDAKTFFRTGDATIGVRSEADPAAIYYVELSGGFFKNRNFSLQVSEGGLISGADSSVEDRTIQFVVKTLEVTAAVAGKALVGALGTSPTAKTPHGKVIEQVKEIRKRRFDLISGTRTPSGGISAETLGRMLKELDEAEAALLRNFTGHVETKTIQLQFEVRPTAGQLGQPIRLGDFSRNAGLAYAPGPGVVSSTVPANFTLPGDRKPIELELKLSPVKEEQMFSHVKTPSEGRRSYYYRVPASALVRLLAHDAEVRGESPEVARKHVAISQFGTIVSLPRGISSASSRYKPTYYVESGAIKELSVQGQALDPGSVASVGTAATTVLGAVAERERIQLTERDELYQLKRQADLLEQRKRIRELEKKLLELE